MSYENSKMPSVVFMVELTGTGRFLRSCESFSRFAFANNTGVAGGSADDKVVVESASSVTYTVAVASKEVSCTNQLES